MFRNISNLNQFNDDEHGFPPSEVDESAYEPLETTIKRFERCGGIPQFLGEYDDGDPEDLLDKFGPEDDPNLDLADIAALEERAQLAQVKVAREAHEVSKGENVSEESQKSSTETNEAPL